MKNMLPALFALSFSAQEYSPSFNVAHLVANFSSGYSMRGVRGVRSVRGVHSTTQLGVLVVCHGGHITEIGRDGMHACSHPVICMLLSLGFTPATAIL